MLKLTQISIFVHPYIKTKNNSENKKLIYITFRYSKRRHSLSPIYGATHKQLFYRLPALQLSLTKIIAAVS